MAHDNSRPDAAPLAAKRKAVDIATLFGPSADISTSIGTLFLYGLRVSDFAELRKLSESDPHARVRAFIPIISSLVADAGIEDKRQRPSAADISLLSHEEVEAISEKYLKILLSYEENSPPPSRESGEDVVSYLDRVLAHTTEAHGKQMLAIHENALKSTGVFAKMRNSSSALEETVNQFERLSRGHVTAEISRTPQVQFSNVMADQFARQRNERREELEMVRLTGQMTAESARTLKDLAEAAATLLEQADERDKRTDASTRHQVKIAVWSVGISAFLAAIALFVAVLGFMQDRSNNEAGDKWQAELLDAVRVGTRQGDDAEKKVKSLQEQIVDLNAKVQHLESRQPASALNRKKMNSSVGQ